jgi:hypothetical protein
MMKRSCLVILSFSRDKPTPLAQTQMTTNVTAVKKTGRDVGKRLFESGTYQDPRLVYDVSLKFEWYFLYSHLLHLGIEEK